MSDNAVLWQRLHPTQGWVEVDPLDVAHYANKGQLIRPLYVSSPSSLADPLVAAMVEAATGLRDAHQSNLFNQMGEFYEPGREPEVVKFDTALAALRAATSVAAREESEVQQLRAENERLTAARVESLDQFDAREIAAMIERKGVEHDRFNEGWGVPDNSVVVFEAGNITKYLPIRILTTEKRPICQTCGQPDGYCGQC